MLCFFVLNASVFTFLHNSVLQKKFDWHTLIVVDKFNFFFFFDSKESVGNFTATQYKNVRFYKVIVFRVHYWPFNYLALFGARPC